MKEEIKKSRTFCVKYYMKKWKAIFVSYKKYTANENSSFRKTKQNSLTLLSNCAICSKKKLAFIQNQELNNVSTD